MLSDKMASDAVLYAASRKLESADGEESGVERKLSTTTSFFDIEVKLDASMMDDKYTYELENLLSSAFYHAIYPGTCAGGFTEGEDVFYLIGELLDMNAGLSFDDALNFCDKMMTEVEELDSTESDAYFGSSENMFYSRRLGASTADKAMISSLMFEYCDSLVSSDGSSASAAGGALALKHSHAWGSYLLKSTPESTGGTMNEYVVAFQGTKGNDFAMIQYSLDQQPIAVSVGSTVMIVASGHWSYMSSLMECFDWMQTETSSIPTFVTGHSLGGAAATLYVSSKSTWTSQAARSFYPRLVTFGAAATSYAGTPVTSATSGTQLDCDDSMPSSYCSGGFVTPAGFKAAFPKGMSTYCANTPPQSVRFQHKFDPIPSMSFMNGIYKHGVENAIFLWEGYDASCTSYDPSCSLSSKSLKSGVTDYTKLGLKGTNPEMIEDWVCSKAAAVPLAYATKCEDQLTSYMTMMNPFPCGYITLKKYTASFTKGQILDGTVDHIDTVGDIRDSIGGVGETPGPMIGAKWFGGPTVMVNDIEYDVYMYLENYFKILEDFDTCVSDWVSTLYVHSPSATASSGELGLLLFTFTWVHSSYAMFPLCVTEDASGEVVDFIPPAMVSTIEAEFDEVEIKKSTSCTASLEDDCEEFCYQIDGYDFDPDCWFRCIENPDCKPVAIDEINTKYGVATSDLETYGGSDYASRKKATVIETYGDFETAAPSMSMDGM
jgi:hypothetical protein